MEKQPEKQSQEPKPPKKPYAKPAIVSREKIEGRANVCDPLAGGKATAPQCGVTRS